MDKILKINQGFVKGLARLSDRFGKVDFMEQKTDSEKLASDWETTGKDIKKAIIDYPEENNGNSEYSIIK